MPSTLKIERRYPAVGGTQHVRLGDQAMGAGIGVDDAARRVDDEHAGSQFIETVGERCCLDAMKIDHLANEHGAPDVRRNQFETPPHAIIDWPLTGVAHGGEQRTTRRALLQVREKAVHQALGSEPFAKEARPDEFLARNHVGNGYRALHVEKNDAGKDRIYLTVFLQVDLEIMRSVGPPAPPEQRIRCPADRVLRMKAGRGGADVPTDTFDGVWP